MGRDTLTSCNHERTTSVYEDHVLMGDIYYGEECIECGTFIPQSPGPLELGVYR